MIFIYTEYICKRKYENLIFICDLFWKSFLMNDINPRISKKHFVKSSQFSHRRNIGGNNFEEKSLDTIETVET